MVTTQEMEAADTAAAEAVTALEMLVQRADPELVRSYVSGTAPDALERVARQIRAIQEV